MMSVMPDAAKKSGRDISVPLSEKILRLKNTDRMEREDAASELSANPDPQTAFELCRLLADPDIPVRNLVAEVLVNMAEVSSPALIAEALSPDHDVRKFVVDIMSLIKDREYLPVLIKLLNDPNENVVGSAAEALGQIGDASAVEALIECIHRHPDSRPQAIEALGKIGSPEALPVLFSFFDSDNIVLAYAAIEAVGKIGSAQAVNKLLILLKKGNPALKVDALAAILKIGGGLSRDELNAATDGQFVDYLIKAAGCDDKAVKSLAISELAFWNGDRIVKALIDALQDADEEVINLAKGALRIAGNTGLDEFIKRLQSGDDRIKVYLIEIASFLKDSKLLGAILDQAGLKNPDIRLKVAATLAKFSDSRIIPVLLNLANDAVGHVRAEALKSIGLVAGESEVYEIAAHLDDEYTDVREVCLGSLVLIGGHRTIELFKRDIESGSVERKILAVRGLGWIGEDQAIDILVRSLNHEEAEVRRYAVAGLAKIRYKELAYQLNILQSDENPEVRKAVIDAYVEISGDEAVENIKVLLDDQDMWVRFYAINALTSLDAKSCLGKLLEILPEQAPFVQIAIINLIAKYDDSRITAELKKLVKHENEDIRNTAKEALENRKQK